LLTFLTLSSSIACIPQGEFNNTQKKFIIHEDFNNYVTSFENEIGEKVEINISYSPQEYPIVAMCYYYPKYPEMNYIEVDETNWNNSNEGEREEIIFHELGHCVLGRDHDNNIIEAYGVPKSIMYPYVFWFAFEQHREYYTSELKNSQTDWTTYFQ